MNRLWILTGEQSDGTMHHLGLSTVAEKLERRAERDATRYDLFVLSSPGLEGQADRMRIGRSQAGRGRVIWS